MDALQTVSLVVGLLVLFGLLALGLPLYIAFAASSIILFVGYAQLGTWAVPQIVHNALDKYVFTAIPMFVMVGSLMDKGGAGDAYFRLIGAFVGHVRGGLAVTAIIACAFFGAVCGSSLATAVAIGAVVGPEMLRAGYPREIIAAVTASGGTLGIIIPPSLAMIILGDVTGTSVGALFIAGIVPGVLCTVLLSIVAYFRVRRIETIKLQPRATARERWDAFVYAIPALIIPAAILGTIYGGLVTPTESAIIAVVLSFAVGVLVYRKLTVRRFVEALKSTAIVTGVIYSLVFACIMFGRVLAFARLPQQITGFIAAADVPRTVFLFSFVGLFFVFGMFLEAMILYYVALPPLLPALQLFHIDMLPFCILFVFIVMLGQITPPVGPTLYGAIAGVQANTWATLRAVWPFLLAILFTTLLVAFWPGLTTFVVDYMA